jgi:hypothetical protein
MIWDVHTGFRIPDADLDFLLIPDSGSKGTGSRIRIRKTALPLPNSINKESKLCYF